jgi:hypothetical protein
MDELPQSGGPVIRNHVFEALTGTLTRKVSEQVGNLTRYALLMEVEGKKHQINAVSLSSIPGVVDIEAEWEWLTHSLLIDSLKYTSSESGLITGTPLRTSAGEIVYGTWKKYWDIAQVYMKWEFGMNLCFVRSHITAEWVLERISSLESSDERVIREISGYDRPGILRVIEEWVDHRIRRLSWEMAKSLSFGKKFFVYDRFNGHGKLQVVTKEDLEEKEEKVETMDGRTVEMIQWFRGLPWGVGIIYDEQKTPYAEEGEEVYLTGVTKDGKYEIGAPLRTVDGEVISLVIESGSFPFIRVNQSLWARPRINEQWTVETFSELKTTEWEIIDLVYDDLPENLPFHKVKTKRWEELYIASFDENGTGRTLKTRKWSIVREIKEKDLCEKKIDWIFRLYTDEGVVLAKLENSGFKELSSIDSRILLQIIRFTFGNKEFLIDKETGKIAQKAGE